MTEEAIKTYKDLILPVNVVSKLDVSRMITEFETVDNELTGLSVRAKAGAPEGAKPVLSDELTEFVNKNSVNVDDSQARSAMVQLLHKLKDNVPMVHMTFAVTADRDSLQQLANWFRSSVHPQAVIEVGLQPALVAGVYLRTPNHVKDLSMRGALQSSHDLLVKELETLRGTE